MKTVRSFYIFGIILVFLFAQLPTPVLAGENQSAPFQESTRITKNSPRVLTTPEERIPTEKTKTSTKVALGVLGTALIVGVVAAFAGGGGGSDSSGPAPGSVSVGW
jgi:hypothetical protein